MVMDVLKKKHSSLLYIQTVNRLIRVRRTEHAELQKEHPLTYRLQKPNVVFTFHDSSGRRDHAYLSIYLYKLMHHRSKSQSPASSPPLQSTPYNGPVLAAF
jgi:hypothetical protein